MRIENVPHRIVLSRKGFDSSAGGCASPILNGEMISLPIPEHNLAWRRAQTVQGCPERHLTYGDLTDRRGANVAELVAQLANGRIRRSDCVHLDPDIRPSLRDRRDTASPLTYGQESGSQTELSDLREGDLFLFFGWFRKAQEVDSNVIRFAIDGADVHAIWGWLQIAERLELPSQLSKAQEIASHHPHVSHHAKRIPNCLYVARESLTFLPGYEGAGIFRELQDELCLSDKQLHLHPRKRLRSRWRLPRFFRSIHLTHHTLSEWELVDEWIFGKGGAYPGQEFVFETKGHENDVAKWLEGIFSGEQRTYA